MKPAELRDKDGTELKQMEGDLRRELFNLRFQSATGDIQNPRRIRTVRKEIARVLTIMGEKTKH